VSSQILRPAGAGAETNIAGQYPTSGEHWDKVDEVTPDDATTYVRHNLTSYATDTYALPAGEGIGDIDKVTVFARCYGISGSYNYAKTVSRTHGTLYQGIEHNLSANWENLSTEYTVNPYTNQPWTWTEINALEAGVSLKSSSSGSFLAICTQVCVEVTYHTETPKSSSDAGTGAGSSQVEANLIAGAESGSGAEASLPEASFSRAESGNSLEGLAFLANLLGDEMGSAIEELGDRGIVLNESSESTEASSLGATPAATEELDNGLDGSAGQEATFVRSEAGSGGEDTTAAEASLARTEMGSGAEAGSLFASLSGSGETGSALEALANRAITTDQSGSGLAQTLTRLISTSQAGSGQDITSDLWKGTGDKDMQRSDSGGGAEAVHDRLMFLPDSGVALDTLLWRSLSAREGYGHALSFDGVDDKVDCGNGDSLKLQNAITWEVWFKADEDQPAESSQLIILTKHSNFYCGLLFRAPSNQIYFNVISGGSYASRVFSISRGVWYYLAGVATTSSFSLYVDGDHKGTSSGTFVITDDDAPVRIAGGVASRECQCLIAQARISDVVRTQAEITANWNDGRGKRFELDEHTAALWHMDEGAGSTAYDETDNQNNGTITGASWVEGCIPRLSGVGDSSLLAALTRAETGSGADALLARLLAVSETGTGLESLLSRLLQHTESGLGSDTYLTLLATLARTETGSGLDALAGLVARLAAAETGSGIDELLSREIARLDSGIGLDWATLYKVFTTADSGVGLEVLSVLAALLINSEAGSGSDEFRARVMTASGAGDMKLPTKLGKTEIPSEKVDL